MSASPSNITTTKAALREEVESRVDLRPHQKVALIAIMESVGIDRTPARDADGKPVTRYLKPLM